MNVLENIAENIRKRKKDNEKNKVLLPDSRDIVKKNKAGLEWLLSQYLAEIRFKTVDGGWKYILASSNPVLIHNFDPGKTKFRNTRSTFYVRTWDFIKNGYCTINLKCWEWGKCLKIENDNFDAINSTLRNLSSMGRADGNLGEHLDRKEGKLKRGLIFS